MANGLFNLKQVVQAVQQGGWPAQKTPAVEYLVVAGGGGGGYIAGGGGAGGLLTGLDPVPNGQTLLVTVGSGGAGGTGGAAGVSGNNSVFGAISPTGGGAGGSYPSVVGAAGGSGGGAENGITSGGLQGRVGQGIVNQGNAGGRSYAGSNFTGGGGGGAGTVGLTSAGSDNSAAGNGGAGIASAISGTVVTYAGGGGGAADTGGTGGSGGVGGGGAGGVSRGATGGTGTVNGASGTANTGGGGGGYGISGTGGTGGTGIVIVSYPDVYAAPTATTGSPTVSTSGSGSVLFNGSTQFLNYAAQSPFAFGTGDFTIELWAYPTGGLAATPSYIDFRGSSSSSPAAAFYNNNGILSYFVAGSNVITASYSTLNAWVHLAVCRIGTATKMYINGTQVGSTYTDTNNYVVGTGGPHIGQNGNSGGYYTGYISNLRVVKGVGVYTGTFTPPTAPLTTTQSAGTNIAAITGTQTSLLLNSVSGAYTADSSTNSYAPTTTISLVPTWNALSPFTVTGYKNRVYTWTSSGSITF